ncbi:RNA polymerase sigma-70 factor [Mucilaginibacter sp. SJ]|uniref:RNA polymerase sigma-70 factor n=1 Tax=Mucilaginibacter sp. SJ TaxID=3029053 RepID=UPI0023A945FA|nr:RNA polymerase sigma-70 factor [Mucilaginibacter sp. SJ]WEA00646.1 RNA polymerase sigma-70 factor [Mucilaginibacter sp. SJ]
MKIIELDDAELLKRLQSGDREAFNTLYYRYLSKLYSVVYKRVKSKEVAEEIIQELFTTLWVKRADLAIEHAFASYIFTAVKYMVFKYFRSEQVRRTYIDSAKAQYADLDNYTEEAILFEDLNKRFEGALKDLPAKSGHVFRLSRKENKSNKEIAQELNITEKAVEYHITKALAILRANLKDFVPFIFLLTAFYR